MAKKEEVAKVAVAEDPAEPIEQGGTANKDKESVELLTAKERKEAQERWEEKVEHFNHIDISTLEKILLAYHERGSFVQELIDNPRHYGNRTVEVLAETLDTSERILYGYRAFFATWSEKEVREKAARKIPWHVLYYLINIKDKKVRDDLEDRYRKEKWTAERLQLEVKKANHEIREEAEENGKPVNRRGGVTPLKIIRKTASMAGKLGDQLEELGDAVKDTCGIEDEERIEDISNGKKEAKSALTVLQSKIGKALGELGETVTARSRKQQ